MREEDLEEKLEIFDAAKIKERMKKVEEGVVKTIFTGNVFWTDSDLYNSTGLKRLLEEKKIPISFYSDYLKDHTPKIIEKHGGYHIDVLGDNTRSIFGNLEDAVKCTDEISKWFDRDFSEYVKDYIISWIILGENNKISDAFETNDKLTKDMIKRIRKIKDDPGAWYLFKGENLLEGELEKSGLTKKELEIKRFKSKFSNEELIEIVKLKIRYESIYKEIDAKVSKFSDEKRGRLVAKSAIGVEQLIFKFDGSAKSISLDGPIRYLADRMTRKEGPLKGKIGKDKILVTLYSEDFKWFDDLEKEDTDILLEHIIRGKQLPNDSFLKDKISTYRDELFNKAIFYTQPEKKNYMPEDIRKVRILKNLPDVSDLFLFGEPEQHRIGKDVLWTYESKGIDYFSDPTLGGIVSEESPLAKNFLQVKEETLKEVDFLRKCESRCKDIGGKLVVIGDESKDKFKRARTLKVASILRQSLKEFEKLYDTFVKAYDQSESIENSSGNSFDFFLKTDNNFYVDITKDSTLRSLKENIEDKTIYLIRTALVWNLGGAKQRGFASDEGIPQYATRLLAPDVNHKRKENERRDAYSTIAGYNELVEEGVAKLIGVQDYPISYVEKKYGEGLAIEKMFIDLSNEYVKQMDERSFKSKAKNAIQAINNIREEMWDILRPDGSGHVDQSYAFVEASFLKAIGLKKSEIPFIPYEI